MRALGKISLRAVSGVAGAAVAAGVIAGATLLPLPRFAIDVPTQVVRPVPADQQRVCPGPILALAADAAQASRPAALGEAAVSYSAAGLDVQAKSVTPDADTSSPRQTPLALTLATPSGATEPPLFAGAQAQTAGSADVAGFAAASCSEPAADSWLVAGATTLGQTSLVLLANPTSVEATADLTIYTETGLVDAPGGTGIVVPAGSQKAIPLAGLAPYAAAPVVRVRTTGGQIVATMQQSFQQGIQPRGVEQAGATGAPARVQRIAGMRIATLDAVTAGQSSERAGADFPAVRILVPGDQDAQLTIGAVGESGTAAGNSYAQTVKAGNVAEIPLQNLRDGNYTVTINSSVPVVAAARTSVIGSQARDFSWFASSPPLGDAQLVTVPSGPAPLLHFANPTEGDADITLTPQGGAPISLKVPAEGGASYAVPAGHYAIEGADGLTASVSFAGDGASSAFALNPPGPLAAPITVRPR